jgi:hypothetical protein
MADKPHYNVETMIAAIRKFKGMKFLVAKELGCSHDTVSRYIERYATVRQAFEAQRGEMVDESELRLWHAIQGGEAWAIAFCLRTLGRERGYVPQVDNKTLTDQEGLATLLQQARSTGNGTAPHHE